MRGVCWSVEEEIEAEALWHGVGSEAEAEVVAGTLAEVRCCGELVWGI